MTTADRIHEELTRVCDQASPERIAEVAKLFYERIDCRSWHFAKICHVNEFGWSVFLRCYLNGEHKNLLLSHDKERNRWSFDGLQNDAAVAESLGVPCSYLEGFSDGLYHVAELASDSKRLREEAYEYMDLQHKALERVEARLKKLDEDQAFNLRVAMARREIRQELTATIEVRVGAESAAAYKKVIQRVGDFPDVPAPLTPVPKTINESELPLLSGIYFVWKKGRVVYVGQSVNLRNRVTLQHEKIEHGDFVSWSLFPVKRLNYIESFYIGVCEPSRNFGKRQSKRESSS